MNREVLIRSLIQAAASGKLDAKDLEPLLRQLVGEPSPAVSFGALLDALEELQAPDVPAVAAKLREARQRDAVAHHGLRSRGQPVPEPLRAALSDLPLGARPGWSTRESAMSAIQGPLRMLADRFFAASRKDQLPGAAVAVEKKYQEATAGAFLDSDAWAIPSLADMVAEVERQAVAGRLDLSGILPMLRASIGRAQQDAKSAVERTLAHPDEPIPASLDAETFFAALRDAGSQARTREEKQRLLDLAFLWPSDKAAPFLLDLPQEPWAEERASLILSLRFGQPASRPIVTWNAWRHWLQVSVGGRGLQLEGSRVIVRKRPLAMLYLWYSRQPDADPAALAALEKLVAARIEPVSPADFVDRWAESMSAEEITALTGVEPKAVQFVDEPQPAPVVPVPFRETKVVKVLPPRPPPKPSVWDAHLKPFFLENWYMVAGVAMVLVGSSLLAFYTWDKGWLLRYTIMPSVLGAFTAALAWLGGWIERKDAGFKGTGAVLRGAAIGLLPINFMAVALLANDADVKFKAAAVPVMGAVYFVLFGWGLRKWCAAVHPGLGFPLGGTILFLNMLVMLAGATSVVKKDHLLPVIGTGFYLGFFALMAAVIWFSRKILNGELAKEKRVVWFFGAALAVTYLQVFAWVHGYLTYLPKVGTYAPMVVLTGWLVLFMERRTLELRGEGDRHGAESFLGFAFILLGVLMGAADQHLRIVTLALAGAVWIYQSIPRRQPLHSWIGLTFIVLGGASIGLVDGFEPTWLPALGIGLAAGLGVFALLARSNEELRRAAGGMQAAVLIVSVLVTVLSQYHFRTNVLAAAAHLAVISALFAVRGWRDRKIRWVQTAMVVLALTLPYLAGMDVAQQRLHSTTLVFGLALLSVLWIVFTLCVKSPLVLGARSTVLWIYGAMAVACMAARATIDPAAIHDAPGFDIGGPLLMTAALVWAGYFSRSLVPSGMAMAIALVLTPELKDRLQEMYPHLGWGSGLGSSLAGLGLILGAMILRRMPALQDLGFGDKYMGVHPYPLLRRNHSLFTLPMVASALFLAVKVETWNLFLKVGPGGPSEKMAIALFVSGVIWTLFAVYMRGPRGVQAATYVGLFWMIVGLAVGVKHVVPNPDAATVALVPALFVQAFFLASRFFLERRYPWAADLLTSPARMVLRLGSVLIALVSMGALLFTELTTTFGALTAFAALNLAWHGLASRRQFFGYVLFALDLATLGSLASHRGEAFIVSALGLVISVQVLQAALEFRKPWYEFLRPLLVPFQTASTLLAVCIAMVGLRLSVEDHGFESWQLAMTMVALLLSARALSSGPLALLALLVGYVLLESRALSLLTNGDLRWAHLIEPSRASFLAFTMAVLGHAGSRIHQVHPVVLSGSFAPWKWPATPWMFFPAALLAALVSITHTADPSLRGTPMQLFAPYVSAATVGVIAFSTGRILIYHGTGVLLTLGNVHLVRVVVGPFLLAKGLSEVHLIAMGIALTLLQGTLIRLLLRKPDFSWLISQASLAWAGLILFLISANYLVHPNLATISPARFALSGAMAFLAGWYFRRSARKPAPGEEPFVKVCEGLYHFGITIAVWCGALMIPALRHPVTALISLALPVLYFYLRAEDGFRRNVETFVRYRTSAATLGFIVLAMYAFRGVVQMVIFPEAKFDTTYYHANSPVVFVLGLALLRLHALRGTSWLAFYGGLAVMTATTFAVTALPGLSPFHHPAASAWCALAVAHFFTIASIQQSPLRTAIQRLASIDAPGWLALRRPWGLCLLVAAHGMVLWAVADHSSHPRMIAPLIVGAASLLLHQGILRQSRVYPVLAQMEIAIALHMGFLVDSLLLPRHVVWALLAVWAAMLVAQPIVARLGGRWEMGLRAVLLAGLTFAHVLYHHPWSPVGLWAFALGAVLLAMTPRATRVPQSMTEVAAATILPFVPAWLVWFSQAPVAEKGFSAVLQAWPALATAATLLATGALAAQLPKGWAEQVARSTPLRPRLYDQTITWLGLTGGTIHTALLWISFLITALVQITHWGGRYTAHELILLEGLYAALAVAWLFEGRARKVAGPYFLVEVCLLGAYLAAREQFQLTRGGWKYEVDVWASLVAFFALVGAKQVMEQQPRGLRVPLNSTMLALPLFSVAWIVVHSLPTELGLLVVGLHSAAFAYMGKDDRESPYHLVAIAGFVAFVMMLFWSKLHLMMVYAYVIPVGVGVLVLLQLFKGRVAPEARNGIRAVTVLAMLGSSGWAALTDRELPLLANVVVMGLCLASMAMGGLLRIRMYVALGFGGLILDLLSLLVKMVAKMDRSIQMTAIGSLVLLVGAGLVFGAIYYKTHRPEIAQLLERWKLRFAGWE